MKANGQKDSEKQIEENRWVLLVRFKVLDNLAVGQLSGEKARFRARP
ncbi:MAG: hypothetical protein MZV64_71450 [Ignavibacteriales bacterium]|nr:hypothetical protein [Ignavibacteriales bacterium]